MTRIVIVLSADGTFETVLGDTETDITILKRGEDDREIDKAEGELTEVEYERS